MQRWMPTSSLIDMLAGAVGRPLREYSKRGLIVLSHELEDRATLDPPHPPLLFGGFQRGRFFRPARRRWSDFAAHSTLTVVAAGGIASRPPEPGRTAVLSVGPGDPFWHDWVCLVYGGPEHAGVLIARDLGAGPEHEADGVRRCRGLITHDARVVRAAATWVGNYLVGHDVTLARRWNAALAVLPQPPAPRTRRRVARV